MRALHFRGRCKLRTQRLPNLNLLSKPQMCSIFANIYNLSICKRPAQKGQTHVRPFNFIAFSLKSYEIPFIRFTLPSILKCFLSDLNYVIQPSLIVKMFDPLTSHA